MSESPLPPVINCYDCGRTYRMGRPCPNCARRRVRQQLTPRTFADQIDLMPHLAKWLERNGYLPDIEASWRTLLRPRLNKYGLSPLRWAQMVVDVESACQICRTEMHPLKLHIDHDHEAGHVRGLLCSRCNTGIGMLRIDGQLGAKRAASVRAYISQTWSTRPNTAGRRGA